MAKKKGDNKFFVFLVVVIFALYWINYSGIDLVETTEIEETQMVGITGERTINLRLPAVDNEGVGVLATLTVEVMPGDGKELINIDKLVFWEDTQQSIRTAKEVASTITGVDPDQVDIIYSIRADDAVVVGGPSAGAALTIATIAALENEKIRDDVIITGTIDEFGKIGPVGGIAEKAHAVAEGGANLFLIPLGESVRTYVKPVKNCVERPHFTYCEITYEKINVYIGDQVDIEIREVGEIREALEYFLIRGTEA